MVNCADPSVMLLIGAGAAVIKNAYVGRRSGWKTVVFAYSRLESEKVRNRDKGHPNGNMNLSAFLIIHLNS